ncbi:WXG100 family type VII secretion target [Amycolatopsis sp. TRM77291]
MSDEYHRNDFGNATGTKADDFKDENRSFLAGSGDTAGAGFFDSAFSLKKAVDDGDSLSIGLASAGMAIEILGMVVDPIGSLLTAGIGWLIEHIVIFRWPLDFLLGDPKGIEEAKTAIYKEGAEVREWANDHAAATKKFMEKWEGEAADAFRADMEGVAAQIEALAGYIEFAGKQMGIAGAVIGAVRGIVRDIIAMTLAGILKAAIVAVALAPVTFGGSIIAAIGSIMTTVAVAIAKIAKQIADVAKKLAEMIKILAKTRGAADEVVKLTLNGGKITLPKPKPGGGTPMPGGKKPIEGPPPKPGDTTPDTPPKPPREKLSDMPLRIVREKLAKELEGVDGAADILKRFDYWNSFPIGDLHKRFPKVADAIEKTTKILSDPTYGASGMAGKTIVELTKAIPPAANEKPPEDKEEQ